ncbi:MAG: 4Fe-4S binding protein [Bacillota bacterium]
MDLEKIASLLENLNPVNVHEILCSRNITPKSSCHKCTDICPIKGISLKNNKPKIDNCISCGLCVSVCPNHVFKQDEDLLLQVDPQKTQSLIITCPYCHNLAGEKYKQHFTVIKCLNQLYPELLLKLSSRFAKVLVFYNTDRCKDCFPTPVFQPDITLGYENILEQDSFNLQFTQEFKEVLPHFKTESPAHDRRLFFKSIFSGSQKASKNIINSTLSQLNIDVADQEKVKPLKRKYLSEALSKITVNTPIKLPLKNLQIKKCNFCGVCSKLCPTKALKVIEEVNKKQIVFQPHLCTHCDICHDACFFKGLEFSGNLSVDDFRSSQQYIIASGERRSCKECEQDYYDSTGQLETCFLCSSLK